MKKQKKHNYLYNIANFIILNVKKVNYIFYMALPLIVMDIITRLFGHNINFYNILGQNKDFYNIFSFTPFFFTITYIILFLSLTLLLKKKIGKYIYLTINIIFLLVFLTNNIYYSMTNTYFDFILLESFNEGSTYIMETIKNANILIYIVTPIIIFLIYKGYKKIPYKTNNNLKELFFVLIYFVLLHNIAQFSLGKPDNSLEGDTWINPKNVYILFTDNNKSMKISGLYEYTIRNFYMTFLKRQDKQTEEEKNFLNNAYKKSEEYKNEYTGLLEDKNLILVQLEGIDNWILNEEDTPTLYNMMQNSINFTDHYSSYNGGGSTFNSEFAVNTGYITPMTYTKNAYSLNKNYYPNSLANIFKSKGYTVNAFHMNTGEYYSRKLNYKNWGYDNYYGLIETDNYKDTTYTLDRELILNEKFNNLMFPTDKKFVNFIITYSLHMPFINTNGVCKLLYDLDNKNEEFRYMNELECIKRQAKETDYMMELLLNELEKKELIDNTAIVVFTDHYLYTMTNQHILKQYKKTDNNLINKTPFFIWSKDLEANTINKTTAQLNILPTILNLFNANYEPNNYIGKDALNKEYNGIVFFEDYSWYDGNVYVENGIVTNQKEISNTELKEKQSHINYMIKKNDLTLKFNYFKQNK